MATHAAALAEKIFSIVDGLELHISADQNHVGPMAILATCLRIFFGEQGPKPVFVISVRLLYAGGGAAVALMTRRAAEFFRIVNAQQLGLGMARKSVGILIRFFLALRLH